MPTVNSGIHDLSFGRHPANLLKQDSRMKKNIWLVALVLSPILGVAQREKGKVVTAPKINTSSSPNNKKNSSKPTEKESFPFVFEEETQVRFLDSYNTTKKSSAATSSSVISNQNGIKLIPIEPLKDVNRAVQDDTSSIDEGDIQIVEIEEEATFMGSDEMVQIASYFSVWDTRRVNPYGISPREFDEVIQIKLYDVSEGRLWASPMETMRLTSHFGWRWKRWHTGTDFGLTTGEPIRAAFDGIIRVATVVGAYGRCVVIRHFNGLETLYGHLSKINFPSSTYVKAGDIIGLGGSTGRSTGPHLHFETRYEGNPFNTENIYSYASGKAEIRSQEFTLSSKLYDYLRGGSSKIDFEYEEEEKPVNTVQKVWIKVRSGDTLYKIASRNGTTISEICRLNKIRPSTKLLVGTRLRIK